MSLDRGFDTPGSLTNVRLAASARILCTTWDLFVIGL